MLFNSYIFILIFLPLVIVGYAAIGALAGRRAALCFLTLASLGFYAWWNPPYVTLIACSILFNFSIGMALRGAARPKNAPHPAARALVTLGVVANLTLLAYYKYANFFVRTVDQLTGAHISLGTVFLPLAISFFTFTQISYLVDVYGGEHADYDFIDYSLFVLFFPHLIAGPVVRHHEILPQILRNDGRFHIERLPGGLTLFALGLFSKVVLADSVAPYGAAIFAGVDAGHAPHLIAAWGGALAYTCQLYFDFSGYSTMALGLGYLFGVKMPFNFNSPYKARSAVDFWRRWHMSLSRFLRDYLYIPLGGNRKGKTRRYINLMITMLLGGLWHGAGWTFVIWGGLHGAYLCVNHAWSVAFGKRRWAQGLPMRAAYHVVTFLAICAGWVVFRASSLRSAGMMFRSMLGLNGISLPSAAQHIHALQSASLRQRGLRFDGLEFDTTGLAWIVGLLALAFLMPNVQQVMRRAKPSFEPVGDSDLSASTRWLLWRPSALWAIIGGIAMAVSLVAMSGHVSEFLYFQF